MGPNIIFLNKELKIKGIYYSESLGRAPEGGPFKDFDPCHPTRGSLVICPNALPS